MGNVLGTTSSNSTGAIASFLHGAGRRQRHSPTPTHAGPQTPPPAPDTHRSRIPRWLRPFLCFKTRTDRQSSRAAGATLSFRHADATNVFSGGRLLSGSDANGSADQARVSVLERLRARIVSDVKTAKTGVVVSTPPTIRVGDSEDVPTNVDDFLTIADGEANGASSFRQVVSPSSSRVSEQDQVQDQVHIGGHDGAGAVLVSSRPPTIREDDSEGVPTESENFVEGANGKKTEARSFHSVASGSFSTVPKQVQEQGQAGTESNATEGEEEDTVSVCSGDMPVSQEEWDLQQRQVDLIVPTLNQAHAELTSQIKGFHDVNIQKLDGVIGEWKQAFESSIEDVRQTRQDVRFVTDYLKANSQETNVMIQNTNVMIQETRLLIQNTDVLIQETAALNAKNAEERPQRKAEFEDLMQRSQALINALRRQNANLDGEDANTSPANPPN